MDFGCMLPGSVGRQLAGTLNEQLAHLRAVLVSRDVEGRPSDVAPNSETQIDALLRGAGGELTSGDIERAVSLSKCTVNKALRNLEGKRRVSRRPIVRPGCGGLAYVWSAI